MTTPTSPQALARALLLAAEKATTGPWDTDLVGIYGCKPDIEESIMLASVYADGGLDLGEHARNAEFIALANPSNLTALVTWAMEMERELEELRGDLNAVQTVRTFLRGVDGEFRVGEIPTNGHPKRAIYSAVTYLAGKGALERLGYGRYRVSAPMETTAEHIARDIREGRFPGRSPRARSAIAGKQS